jgi:hypothetical protein
LALIAGAVAGKRLGGRTVAHDADCHAAHADSAGPACCCAGATAWLNRLGYWHGVLASESAAAVMTLSIYYFGGELYRPLGSD